MLSFKTVLFDLDGTLLPIDIDEFLDKYFRLLTTEFSDLAEPEDLISILSYSTKKMINNDGSKTNKEVFITEFFSQIDVNNKQEIMKQFDSFYCNKFPELKKGIEINTAAVKLVNLFKEEDLQLVIATNPLFPRCANEERIKWAGLDPDDFSLITSYDNMHFAKPNMEYYQEILEKISSNPEECIMIGNDLQEDIVAKKIGIKSYLVEDYLIDRGKGNLTPDWWGSMAELFDYFSKKVD